MIKKLHIIIRIILVVIIIYFLVKNIPFFKANSKSETSDTVNITSGSFDRTKAKTDIEWKKVLTQEQYHILREKGTEIPFTGDLNYEQRNGTYYSVGCDTPLFRSEQKYESGTGWPSFWAPITTESLVLQQEGDGRTEVLDTCGNHLGHVFDDGPDPTGKRFCMNSIALRFVPDVK